MLFMLFYGPITTVKHLPILQSRDIVELRDSIEPSDEKSSKINCSEDKCNERGEWCAITAALAALLTCRGVVMKQVRHD